MLVSMLNEGDDHDDGDKDDGNESNDSRQTVASIVQGEERYPKEPV